MCIPGPENSINVCFIAIVKYIFLRKRHVNGIEPLFSDIKSLSQCVPTGSAAQDMKAPVGSDEVSNSKVSALITNVCMQSPMYLMENTHHGLKTSFIGEISSTSELQEISGDCLWLHLKKKGLHGFQTVNPMSNMGVMSNGVRSLAGIRPDEGRNMNQRRADSLVF